MSSACMLLAGLVPGRHTFNSLLEAHAAAGDVPAAHDMYDQMKDLSIKADHCTFIALFMVSDTCTAWHAGL